LIRIESDSARSPYPVAFDKASAMNWLLTWAGLEKPLAFDYEKRQEEDLNRLGDCIDQYLDVERLLKLAKSVNNEKNT